MVLIYDKLRVIDGDTIEIRLWPSMLCEKCRILGVDTDERGTKRGEEQTEILKGLVRGWWRMAYVVGSYRANKFGKSRVRDKYGRLLVTVYVWRRWRYVNYAKWMVKNGHIKRGSKWNGANKSGRQVQSKRETR